jgi:hypothetical protein
MSIDWGGIVRPDAPLIELFIRGSVIYLVGFTLLRNFPSEPAAPPLSEKPTVISHRPPGRAPPGSGG